MKRIGKQIAEAQKKDLKGLSLSEWDIKNIAYLIAFYEKAYPGRIKYFQQQAFKEVEPIRKLRSSTKFQFSRRMSIPQDLLIEIKRGYPAIVSDKRQFEQFLRAFPQFDLHRK